MFNFDDVLNNTELVSMHTNALPKNIIRFSELSLLITQLKTNFVLAPI